MKKDNTQRLDFTYDYLHRRVSKIVRSGPLLTSTVTRTLRFVYQGYQLAAELDGTTLAVVRSYTWGLDLTGTVGGGGGVGGLLQIHDAVGRYQPLYNANGNLRGLLTADTIPGFSAGALVASYDYSVFGELTATMGTAAIAATNPLRFASKYYDAETGLYDYNHRFYDPAQGRFINRDPVGEAGGLNLYAYVSNSPTSGWDWLGFTQDDVVTLDEFEVVAEDESHIAAADTAFSTFMMESFASLPSGNFESAMAQAMNGGLVSRNDFRKTLLLRLKLTGKEMEGSYTIASGRRIFFGINVGPNNAGQGVVSGSGSLIITGGSGNSQAYQDAKAAITGVYPGAAKDFDVFEKSGVGLYLNSSRRNEFQSDHGEKYPLPVVFWDPSVAVQRADWSVLSPMEVLYHEVSHAIGYMSDPTAYMARVADRNVPMWFGNAEEFRVIMGPEANLRINLDPTPAQPGSHSGGNLIFPSVT